MAAFPVSASNPYGVMVAERHESLCNVRKPVAGIRRDHTRLTDQTLQMPSQMLRLTDFGSHALSSMNAIGLAAFATLSA